MTIKEYLQEVELLDERIKNKQVELYQLWCLATSITSAPDKEPIQNSGVSDKVGNTVAKITALSEEINQMIDHFIDEKEKRIKLIETLDNALEYTVLHKHYIQYKTFTLIAEEMGYSYDYILEVHPKALKKLENLQNTLKNP